MWAVADIAPARHERKAIMLPMRPLALLALLAALPAVLPTAALELKPCRLPDFSREARCGTYEVFENRATAPGRMTPLGVEVIRGRGPRAAPDPVVFSGGGRGGSAVDSGPGLIEEFPEALRHRDLVLVDIRGIDALRCPRSEESAFETFMDPALVRSCRETLARDHDLSQYTTEAIVDDVNEVRAALGYSKVNLLGASYASRSGRCRS